MSIQAELLEWKSPDRLYVSAESYSQPHHDSFLLLEHLFEGSLSHDNVTMDGTLATPSLYRTIWIPIMEDYGIEKLSSCGLTSKRENK
jgi:hypothetical protein